MSEGVRVRLWVALALVGALVAGCGDDSAGPTTPGGGPRRPVDRPRRRPADRRLAHRQPGRLDALHGHQHRPVPHPGGGVEARAAGRAARDARRRGRGVRGARRALRRARHAARLRAPGGRIDAAARARADPLRGRGQDLDLGVGARQGRLPRARAGRRRHRRRALPAAAGAACPPTTARRGRRAPRRCRWSRSRSTRPTPQLLDRQHRPRHLRRRDDGGQTLAPARPDAERALRLGRRTARCTGSTPAGRSRSAPTAARRGRTAARRAASRRR